MERIYCKNPIEFNKKIIEEKRSRKVTRGNKSDESTEKSSSKESEKSWWEEGVEYAEKTYQSIADLPDGGRSLEETSESTSNFLQLSGRINHAESKMKNISRSHFHFWEAVYNLYKELKPTYNKDRSQALVKKEVDGRQPINFPISLKHNFSINYLISTISSWGSLNDWNGCTKRDAHKSLSFGLDILLEDLPVDSHGYSKGKVFRVIIISVKFEASLYKKKLRDTNLSKRQNCQEEKEHQKYQVTTNKSEISSDVNNNEDGEAIKIDLKRILDEFLRELEVKVKKNITKNERNAGSYVLKRSTRTLNIENATMENYTASMRTLPNSPQKLENLKSLTNLEFLLDKS
ncbi:hypothetical protein RhiirA5_401909 [Rhizophagus irregularis]|uniref:Uncharacterized protein n=1 Tax=Rhizophagus irregularis TaxID=588596 RepID=A0A2N0P9K0_9GLOM|nr:hypothetical protein RhiirA5_401909 [Rhizophagus irregularis]